MPRVFVYGTLRQGEVNHYILQENQLVKEEVRVLGYELRANGLYYPYAFLNPERSIVGDIYKVSQQLIDGPLDDLEGTVVGYYIRHYDKTTEAFIYLKGKDNREDYPLIDSGDWVKYRKAKST